MKISFDHVCYTSKPDNEDVVRISKRIAESIYTIGNTYETAEKIGKYGNSWCPASFIGEKRRVENFEQMQLFALDFDGGVTWDEVYQQSINYRTPILFAYETFSSINQSKFRVVFKNDIPITDIKTANVIILALMAIFKGCDQQCKDVSRLFYGGKDLIYFNESIPTINIESLIMNMVLFTKQEYGVTHYLRKLGSFAKKNRFKFQF